jgi:hypothetical protein
MRDHKNRRAIPHRMESCGYVPVRNDTAKDGLWKINNARQAIYAKRELSEPKRPRTALPPSLQHRYVKLRHWLLNSQAWNSLSGNARALYVELAQRYNGSNNGRIPYSVREAVRALHVSKATVSRLFMELEDHGFVIRTKRGAFSLKWVLW